jgi:hypothetical protein
VCASKFASDNRRLADETNVTGRHANAAGHDLGHAGGGRVRRQIEHDRQLSVDARDDVLDEHHHEHADDEHAQEGRKNTRLLSLALVPRAGYGPRARG